MRPRPRPALRLAVLAPAALALLSGIAGGLVRVGLVAADGALLGHAAVWHAALMMCGFFGTVIGIERAVAVGLRWAYAAPLASGVGALALLGGAHAAGAALFVCASLAFIAVGIEIVRRQRAAHTALLLVAALAWLGGNVILATGRGGAAMHACWFAFLVVTIAAERLEMTRLMRRRPGAQTSLQLSIAALIAGAVVSALDARIGGVLFGLALTSLGIWLAVFDIASRTVRAHGLARYMALALLAGYAWLVVAGAAWAAAALGLPGRDLALHALGLGFIVSMVMAHAPVILPAIARVKVRFGWAFYVPLVLLHGSLALRAAGPLLPGSSWTADAAALNALAIGAFVATVLAAAGSWRSRGRWGAP